MHFPPMNLQNNNPKQKKQLDYFTWLYFLLKKESDIRSITTDFGIVW